MNAVLLLDGGELLAVTWRGSECEVVYAAASVERRDVLDALPSAHPLFHGVEKGHVRGLVLTIFQARWGSAPLSAHDVVGSVVDGDLRQGVGGAPVRRLPLPFLLEAHEAVALRLRTAWGDEVVIEGWGMRCAPTGAEVFTESMPC